MNSITIKKKSLQHVFSLLSVALVSAAGYWVAGIAGYRVVALLLLATVSLLALFLDILPVLLAALLSALSWDYFFIPPRFTFQVNSTEDALLLAMYFVIALVHAVLTYKIREIEKKARLKEDRENSIRLYNTLLNSLSHELRTPIATLIGASDSLLANDERLSDPDKKELLGEISVASLRLNGQVENLLNMSRLESGTIRPKKDWCEIGEIIHSAAGKLKQDPAQQQLQIELAPDMPLFRLDFGLTEVILINLLRNAAQYAGAFTTVTITAACVQETCVITVTDQGPGFPPGEIGKVFDKFYRLSGTVPGGTGLGLSIVKGFTEAQGGTVDLKNVAGGGACFTIRIPAETSSLNELKNE